MRDDQRRMLDILLDLRTAPTVLKPVGRDMVATVAAQKTQRDAVASLTLDEDTLDALLSVIQTIDLLNTYYFVDYARLNPKREIKPEGMQIAAIRAIGTLVYGIAGPLYGLVAGQPEVFTALFGPQLGDLVREHGEAEQQPLERIFGWLERVGEKPTLQRQIDAQVIAIAEQQVKVAAQMGLPEEIGQSITNSLFVNRASGVPIDLEVISQAVSTTGNEVVRDHIKEGRKAISSNRYISPESLRQMDDEKQARFRAALQAAKDTDRAKHGAKAAKQTKPPQK